MKSSKKLKYQGGPSEILESIQFQDYEIKSLKHGNTGNILYRFPSKAHDWENCWTMDLQTAKSGVIKYKQRFSNDNNESEDSRIESVVNKSTK
tara:strand:- start:381 stop:659 length:279 start_codon:yes stop_codon:yes gene_type:complete